MKAIIECINDRRDKNDSFLTTLQLMCWDPLATPHVIEKSRPRLDEETTVFLPISVQFETQACRRQ